MLGHIRQAPVYADPQNREAIWVAGQSGVARTLGRSACSAEWALLIIAFQFTAFPWQRIITSLDAGICPPNLVIFAFWDIGVLWRSAVRLSTLRSLGCDLGLKCATTGSGSPPMCADCFPSRYLPLPWWITYLMWQQVAIDRFLKLRVHVWSEDRGGREFRGNCIMRIFIVESEVLTAVSMKRRRVTRQIADVSEGRIASNIGDE